ncbi:MAG TPA: lytic transglycosylase domain-containing protein [Vicinamibacteria bacterium]|nr:lytic transglycosylase domain-containing protein [Vicinamibacteria bacterium]
MDLYHPDLQELEHDVAAGSLTWSERRQTGVRRLSTFPHVAWSAAALVVISVMVTASILLALRTLHLETESHRELQARLRQFQGDLQVLNVGISLDSRRKQLLLGIRDEIMRVNSRVSLGQAYESAELLLKATEKYPSVDPLLFLAVGIVESGFNPGATSVAEARGLYQIWPATGRLLTRVLGWEYSDEMLYDPATNTEMAARDLDILSSIYHDKRMVLAEYNDGPINAGYLRARSVRVATETSDYVAKVIAIHEELEQKFELGRRFAGRPLPRLGSRREGSYRGRLPGWRLLKLRSSCLGRREPPAMPPRG